MEVLRDTAVRRRILAAFTRANSLLAHQLDGFDHFIDRLLPAIVAEGSLRIEAKGRVHSIKFGQIQVDKPPQLPHEARLRKLTYLCAVRACIVHEIATTEGELLQRNEISDAEVMQIPCMLGSRCCHTGSAEVVRGEDPADPGGYFLINGVEKVIISQMKLRTNTVFVFPTKGASKYDLTCEVRSAHPKKWRSTSTIKLFITTHRTTQTSTVVCHLPFVAKSSSTALEVPLICAWRAAEDIMQIDEASEGDIVDRVCRHAPPDVAAAIRPHVRAALRSEPHRSWSSAKNRAWLEANGCQERLAAKRTRYIAHIFNSEFMPHCDAGSRLDFFALMVCKLVAVSCGHLDVDDRDSAAARRCDTPGPLLSILVRQLFRNNLKHIKSALERAIESNRPVNLIDFLCPSRVGTGINFHFATGTWSLNRQSQNGTCQPLNRMSTMAMISHLRRCSTPVAREGTATQMRQLHSSSWRLFCPAETPEGQAVGLVQNLAICATISLGEGVAWTRDVVVDLLRPLHDEGGTLVYVNGDRCAAVGDPQRAVEVLREGRRCGRLLRDTSICHLPIEGVQVFSDGGRVCAPVINAKYVDHIPQLLRDYELHELWEALCAHGVIDVIDKKEELSGSDYVTALTAREFSPARHTHVEIDQSVILGTTSGSIPFGHHDQGPRIVYQAAMGKQAVGIAVHNSQERFDGHVHTLAACARPLVGTWISDEPSISLDLPAGAEPIVAVMAWSGFNQEDSLLFSKAALERGLFRTFTTTTYSIDLRQGTTDVESFCIPPQDAYGRRSASYDKLDADGLVAVGARVEEGDVICGRVLTRKKPGDAAPEFVRDRSVVVPKRSGGRVTAVVMTQNKDGAPSVRIKVVQERQPQVGDKFSSRHGQKGTIGLIVAQEDMPFTASGISPDIIVHPAALPSRMTVGHLVEQLMAKACAIKGCRGDGTPFNDDVSIESIAAEMRSLGSSPYGKETMYDGCTGRAQTALVFIGPVYYQRLRHMILEKGHSRGAFGPIVALTRQPLEGRSRDGGLRFGEMERDALLAHGASFLVDERMHRASDRTEFYYCAACGSLCDPPATGRLAALKRPEAYCRRCDSTGTPQRTAIPYATGGALFRELEALHIKVKPVLASR